MQSYPDPEGMGPRKFRRLLCGLIVKNWKYIFFVELTILFYAYQYHVIDLSISRYRQL